MRKIIIGLAPTLLVMSTGAFGQAPSWKVSEVSGVVRLVENGRARSAVRGAFLSSGMTIATGANARAVIVRGQEFVVISPRSQLRIPAPAQASNVIMQIIEDFGTAVFRIQKRSSPHFGVQTPYLAAVVKGTTFTVTVGPVGSSVQVTEGAVQVSTLDGGASDLVRPGGIAQVGASDLYRLTVEGVGSKVIQSDRGVSAGDAKTKALGYVGPSAGSVEVVTGVPEAGKSLAESTDGLIEGTAAVEVAHASIKDLERGNGEGNGRPVDPNEGDGNPPAEPRKGGGDGSPPTAPGNSPPADPGKGNGPPAVPGEGNGNPPAPGNGNGNPPSDPANGAGPPAEPGNGNANPPVDPGDGAGPPAEPGNGNANPPVDPGNGAGPPADPGNGHANPPVNPGNGNSPPADPGNGNPPTVPGESIKPPASPSGNGPPSEPGGSIEPPVQPGGGNAPPSGPGGGGEPPVNPSNAGPAVEETDRGNFAPGKPDDGSSERGSNNKGPETA